MVVPQPTMCSTCTNLPRGPSWGPTRSWEPVEQASGQ